MENLPEPRKENGGTRNPRKNYDCPDHNTTEIGKNIQISSGKLTRLAVSWILEKTNHSRVSKITKSKILKQRHNHQHVNVRN